MFHFIKRFWLVLALTLTGAQSMFGYALLGPFNEAFQVPTIGYHLTLPASSFYDDGNSTDIGAPKNFGQGYRWNTPTNYYAYDESFDRFFGTTGETNIDAAFAMFNDLTNVSDLNLDDWPVIASRVNYQAAALQLLDLKSYTMSIIIEQLGLASPDRWTWCLHDRFLPGGATCPNYEYLIIQRNFDPYTTLYSSYVNDVLYDYQIIELCGLVPANPYAPLGADAVEIDVDPTQQAQSLSAVASYGTGYVFGSFYQSFTRDDIGGLKSLYSATNAYPELAESNSVQILTNTSTPVLLVTSNLALFELQSLTNTDAALLALYPGLVIIPGSTVNGFTNVVTTNISAYLTNPPYAPAGTVIVVLVTNYTTNVQTLYFRSFANLEIVHSYSKGFISQQTVEVGPVPYAPAGTITTNVITSTRVANFTNGDFYILPTNLCGPYQILYTQLVTVVATTNFVPINTNLTTLVTNSTTTNILSLAFITYATNYFLVVYPVDCVTNTAAVREGMEKFCFVRQEFDPILRQLVTPITNIYQLTAISNGVPVIQTFRRILTQPDILIDAADLAAGPAAPTGVNNVLRPTINFVTNLVPPSVSGPGTIEPTGLVFTYNEVGPIYYNTGPFSFLSNTGVDFEQSDSVFVFEWGSFDGTTNAPIIYPDTNSIAQAEAQLFYQITTGLLPTASVSANAGGNPYTVQLQASANLIAPLTWGLASGSAGLPPGLTISSSGLISGNPTTVGTYDFTVQVNDSYGKFTQKAFFIVVTP